MPLLQRRVCSLYRGSGETISQSALAADRVAVKIPRDRERVADLTFPVGWLVACVCSEAIGGF